VGIRETLNKNPKQTYIFVGIILFLTIAVIAYSIRSEAPPKARTKAYYTDDDGKTFFVDDIKKAAPFDRNGKMVYLAHVYICEANKDKKFVGYVEMYNPAEREMLVKITDPIKADNERKRMDVYSRMVKWPGPENRWVPIMYDRLNASKIMHVKCPGGEDAWGVEVFPEE
jgi:hypothetical protein